MKKGGLAFFNVLGLSVFFLLLTSCGGGSKPPIPAQFTVSLNPNSVTLPAGGTAQATLTLKSVGGFSGTILLEIRRSDGAGASEFTVTPNQVDLAANQQVNVLLTISAAITISSGSYSLTVRASAGNVIREAGLSVTVPPPEQVNLPPIISGQGFPQPPLQVGSVSEGASLLAADRLSKIVISPSSMYLRPGESRDIAVWVEDDSGNRYAGDSSFLNLKVAGNPGYRVQWVGPATLRVEAPSIYTPEGVFINVTRPSHEPGVVLLNAIATAAMVEYKPEVVVIPEERIGFPVAYDLDEATVQARFAPFWGVVSAAIDLDSSDGAVSVPALIRDDPNQPIQEGMWIAGEGEAAILAGRVKSIVARSGDVLLLAIEPAMPSDIYSDFQSEVDFQQIIQQGVFPLDPTRVSLSEIQVGTAGYSPMVLSGENCKMDPPEIGTQLDLGQLENISLANLWLEFSAQFVFSCEWGDWGVNITLTTQFGIGRFIFGDRIKLESSTAAEAEFAVSVKKDVEVLDLEGPSKLWSFGVLIYIPQPIAALDLYLEAGLVPGYFDVKVFENYQPDAEIEVFKAGIRGKVAANLVIDSTQSPPADSSISPSLSLFAESPLIGLSTTPGDWSWTVSGEIGGFGLGFVVGVGGKLMMFLQPLLKLLNIHITGENEKPILGVSATIKIIPAAEWKYVTMKRALTQGVQGQNEEPGHLTLSVRIDLDVRLRGVITAAISNGLQWQTLGPFANFVAGLKLNLLERYAARVFPAPVGGLVMERIQDSTKVSGRFVSSGATASAVRAYRLSDIEPYNSDLQPIVETVPQGDTFVLRFPIPTNCGNVPREENVAAIVLWFGFWGNGPQIPLGWTYVGKVALCAPVNLAVPAIRGFVGSEATGVGGLRYLLSEPTTFTLRFDQFSISPDTLRFESEGRQDFNISFHCEEQGSFVDRIQVVAITGEVVAEAPAIVSCITDGDNNSENNPPPDRSSRRTVSFWGDPHLTTPDGAAYDFHATGEFWAVEHPSLSFQLRFNRMPGNPDATYTSRLGAKLGSTIVEVFPTLSWQYESDFLPQVTLTVLVSGEDVTDELKKGSLELRNDTYIAVNRWANVFVNGILVDQRPLEVALVFGGENPRPAVLVQADKFGGISALSVGAVRPGSLAGQLKGLMGNANGNPEDDFVTRNGDPLTPPLGFGSLYQVFGRSWEVAFGERYFTDSRPQFSYPPAPPGLDPEKRTQCEAYCSAIQDPYLREACILDGVVSDDCAGAATVTSEMEQDRTANGQGSSQNSTRTAILGISPSYIHLIPNSEATLVVAHPVSDASAVTYHLRVVGEGPGIWVDGTLLTDNQTSPDYTLQPTESRSHTLAPECDQEDHFYLMQVVEEEATESRSAAILATCNFGFNLSLSPNDFQLYAPGGTAFDLFLVPYGGFTGVVAFSVTDENGNPRPEFTVTPDRVNVTGASEIRLTATLRVSASAGGGAYSLKLRATSGTLVSEAPFTASITPSEAPQWTVSRAYSLDHVDFLNGKFVLYDTYDVDIVVTSTNGNTYEGFTTNIPRYTSPPLHRIAYGNGTYVWVGEGGTIWTSADLAYWMARNSGTTANLYDVTYGGGIFVAVGEGGTILTSVDGSTWRSRNSPVTESISAVAYGNNMFVAASASYFLTSFDGINWEEVPKNFSQPYVYDIAFGGGWFMVVGHNGRSERGVAAASSDGVHWSQVSIGFYPYQAVAYADSSFYVLNSRGAVFRWNPQDWGWQDLVTTSRYGDDLAFGNGKILVSGYYSLATIEFDSNQNAVLKMVQPHLSEYCWIEEVAYANGLFVAGAMGSVTFTSSDGAIWEGPSSIADCESTQDSVTGIAGDENGTFVMVTESGNIFTSQDGLNWQIKRSGETNLYSVAYGNGQFVAVGRKILVSTDGGETWTETLSSLECGALFDVAYGNGKWVAVGGTWDPFLSEGCVYTSGDGVNWGRQTVPNRTRMLTAVAYGNGLFVAVGQDGGIYTSPDGFQWTRQAFRDTPADFTDVAFGNGAFIITKTIGAYSEPKGFFVISHDGIVWTEIEHPFFKEIESLAFGNGRWLAVSSSFPSGFRILTSP